MGGGGKILTNFEGEGMIEGTNERDDNIYLSPRKKINIFT